MYNDRVPNLECKLLLVVATQISIKIIREIT